MSRHSDCDNGVNYIFKKYLLISVNYPIDILNNLCILSHLLSCLYLEDLILFTYVAFYVICWNQNKIKKEEGCDSNNDWKWVAWLDIGLDWF